MYKKNQYGNNKKENSKKDPIFIGIFSSDEKNAQIAIQEYIENNLKGYQALSSKDEKFSSALGKFKSSFKFPQSIHITSFFIGSDSKKLQSSLYKNFEPDVEMKIEVNALVFVPDRIVTGVCFVDTSKIEVENEFPHLTMMVGKWAPKNSNDILKALFSEGRPFQKIYSDLRKDKTLSECVEVEVDLGVKYEKVDAYLIKLTEPLLLPAITKEKY